MGSLLLLSSTKDLVSLLLWVGSLWGTSTWHLHLSSYYHGLSVPLELCGAGELVALDDTREGQDDEGEDSDQVDWSQDPAVAEFVNVLMELGADKLFIK